MRRPLAMAAGIALVLLLGSAPASATTVETYRTTVPYDDIFWTCGYPIHEVGQETDTVVVRADKSIPGNVFGTTTYHLKVTWTAADGRWLTYSAQGVAKDLKARLVSGSLYQFTYNNPGQVAVVTDSAGKVVYRDTGNVSYSYTVDLATGEFTFLGAKAHGPHPIEDAGICKAIAPLLGTDSARYLTARPIGSTEFAMGYYEYLPPSYGTTDTPSPLLIALNGYGETGDGTPGALVSLLNTGIPRFIDIGGWPTDRPLVVLALQHVEEAPGFDFSPCDGVYPWGGSCSMFLQDARNNASPAFCTTPDEVHDFIAYAVDHYKVDPSRVYVTGLSCGGFGAWEYLAKYGATQVAAAIPIAGEGRPAWAKAECSLGDVPIWAFHGELDDTVNPAGSIEPMTSLQGCPGITSDRAKLTVYPGLYHDGWDQAYSGALGDDIYAWMLSYSRK